MHAPRNLARCVLVFLALLAAVLAAPALAAPPADTNGDGEIRMAALSDVEGAVADARVAAAALAGHGVDFVVIAGDLYEDEGHRKHPMFPDSTDNVREMVDGVRPFAELGVPVYVIPGNHESRAVFGAAMDILAVQCPNVRDINGRGVDLDGLNLVGLGGYYLAGRGAPDAFVLEPEDYVAARERINAFLAEQPGEPVVFLTHSPPLSRGAEDYVDGFGHVGDPGLAALLDAPAPGAGAGPGAAPASALAPASVSASVPVSGPGVPAVPVQAVPAPAVGAGGALASVSPSTAPVVPASAPGAASAPAVAAPAAPAGAGGASILNICGHIHERGGEWEIFDRGESHNVASVTPYRDPQAPRVTVFRVTPAGLTAIP
ncbi:MAG: metallophosphoesterase [Desulfovibrionaceae bacterium]